YGRAKQCYSNATMLALVDDLGLTYYEGLAVAITIVPHAWAQDDDGRIYEVTLRHNDARCPYCDGEQELHPVDHHEYRGDGDEFDDDALVACEMCRDGTWPPVSREGTTYLGIPLAPEVVRQSIVENGVFGVLFEDPDRVRRMIERKNADFAGK